MASRHAVYEIEEVALGKFTRLKVTTPDGRASMTLGTYYWGKHGRQGAYQHAQRLQRQLQGNEAVTA